MIDWLLSVVKTIDGTGSTQLLLAGIVPGLFIALVWPRTRAWTRRWFACIGLVYLMLTLPIVANTIASPLAQGGEPYRETMGRLDAVVIFDGDNRRGRINTAKSAFDASKPSTVWVLGVEPEWFQIELPPLGIPADRTRYDTTTGTTRAQLDWVARYQSAQPAARLAVIVSRLQAARVSSIAAALHISNVPIIGAPASREPTVGGPWQFVPTITAWHVSRDAIYEHMALAYYRHSGWIK